MRRCYPLSFALLVCTGALSLLLATPARTTRNPDPRGVGNPDAPITIVEFADFACPHCQSYKGTMDRFVREYVVTGRAKYEFRIFPTAGGDFTVNAGKIAECVEEMRPGGFWEVYELFFQMAQSGRYDTVGREAANRLGLDYAELVECAADATQVQTDIELGRRTGVTGTPSVSVRYGDSDLTWINVNGLTFSPDNRQTGAIPPFEILQAVVEQNQ